MNIIPVIFQLLERYQSTNDVSHLEACFQMIDKDKNGVISLKELKQSFLLNGVKDRDVAAGMLMQAGDLNQDGVLSLPEFVALAKTYTDE